MAVRGFFQASFSNIFFSTTNIGYFICKHPGFGIILRGVSAKYFKLCLLLSWIELFLSYMYHHGPNVSDPLPVPIFNGHTLMLNLLE